MVRKIAATAGAILFAAAVFAAASPAQRIYRAFGLFGTWAPNCAEPASPDNPHVEVVSGDKGLVLEQDDFGTGYEVNRYLIVAARRMNNREVAVDALFAQGSAEPRRQLIVMRVERGTRRTMFTGTGDGPPLVKDGVAVANGKPTPQLNKCD